MHACHSAWPTSAVCATNHKHGAYVQVLLSEEVSGSLRKLRPTATLTRDRFKSLQRQGIIEPRVAAKGRKQPKRVSYTQGERADKAEAGMEETRALQNKRKQK
jgi:nucleolar protein 53